MMDFSNKCDVSKKTPSSSPVPDWEQIPTEIAYNWIDITDEFKNATDQLKLGELVHEPNFGLFEAMSAIEMMDPKMDAGMVGNQNNNQELKVENTENHILKLEDLNFSELITIMDTFQVSILSWLDGHSLAQSVFTCLYLHKPDAIKDRCLRAYCIGTLKLCDVIKDKIYKANVLEEEDFQTMTYGFKFANNVTEMRSIGMLKEIEDEYNRMMRNLKSKQSGDDGANAKEIMFLQGLYARIKFLRLFLHVLLPFGVKDSEVGDKKAIIMMQEQLQIISQTVNLGKESEIVNGKEVIIGVDPLINQRLLPPTFPRYTKLRDRNQFCQCYEKIASRLLLITEMGSLSTFKSILEFIVDFAKTGPCILTRSLVQLAFMPENYRVVGRVLGHSLITDSLKESMRLFNAPLSLSIKYSILYNNPKVKEILDVFIIRATRTMKKLVQVYGHNYARQREKLANLLEDLADLEDEAERCDSDLDSLMRTLDPKSGKSHLTSVGSWTLYHTLRVMIQYVLSGFQLELYSDHEFHYIYWYLAEVLLTWMITTLNRAESELEKEELIADQASKSKKKAKKNKKKGKTHTKELAIVQGMQMMSAGCFKALLGFFICGKLKLPDCKYGNEIFRYEHRFSPFMAVATPPFMPYKQFQEITDVSQYYPPPTAQNLYASSSKHFLQAKQLYEAMLPGEEVNKLLKIAKTNLIVTKLLADGHKQNSMETPHFDFSVHHVFPIFKV